MPMPDLSSAKAKVSRAREHLDAAKQVSDAFLNSEFYKVAARSDKNREKWRVVLKSMQPFPERIGVLLGDAAHNLRSALDHIAFAFAKPEPGREKNVQFPLVGKRKDFRSVAFKCLPGISRSVRTSIERLQPYHRRKRPEARLLGQLQVINNWDKHRALAITAVGLSGSAFNIVTTPKRPLIAYRLFRGRAIKEGAILARFQLAQGDRNVKVGVQSHLTLLPVFDKRMPREVADTPIRLIMRTCDFLEKVAIPSFEKLK